MIYLFHGSDVGKVRAKAFEWVEKARTKEPNLAYVRLDQRELAQVALDELIQSGGLFVQRMLIVLDDPFPKRKNEEEEGSEEVRDDVLTSRLGDLADSDNVFIILAPGLSAPLVKNVASKAKMVYAFDTKSERLNARGFNSALVNALGARSRSALWLEINRALLAGDQPEMLHGLLHWKARDLMQKGSRVWAADDARKLSLNLIALLQESRRGGLELAQALERFALSV